MPYEYANPLFAGYYGHKEKQAELSDLASQAMGREADARYKDALIKDAEAKRMAELANAPFKQRKMMREDVQGEADLEQAQNDFLVQNMGPLLARVQRGEMPEMQFRAYVDNMIGKASSLFPMSDEEIQTMRSWGIPEWKLAHEQALGYKDQTAAPPAPQDYIQGTQKIQKQWNPETRRVETVGEGPRFAPPKPPGQKYGVLQNDRGMPTGFYQVGPNGNMVEMFPSGDEAGAAPSLPERGAIDQNISAIAGQLGPGPRAKEFLSQNVAPLLTPFLGKAGSNAERDAARSRYRAMRANIIDLNKIQGGRSNLYLGLAMEGLPETGLLENPERAQNVLSDTIENLRKAFDAAMETYNNPDTPKKIAVDAYQQAVGISNLFDMLSQPMPGKSDKQPGGKQRRIEVDY